MDSINRQVVEQRASRVLDGMMGAQSTWKGVKGYLKGLRKSVGSKDTMAGNAKDFIRDFGGGI